MKSNAQPVSVFWFRRDLRLDDNAGLYHALRSGFSVLPVFIFDTGILNMLEDRTDRRVDFIYREITALKGRLNELGSDLLVKYGEPLDVFNALFDAYEVKQVLTNTDYEPGAISRDNAVKSLAESKSAEFHSYKDQCIFDHTEINKDNGEPYTVFTPYSKKWKAKLNSFFLSSYPNEKYFGKFFPVKNASPLITLQEMGFEHTPFEFPPKQVNSGLIKAYDKTRDFPAINGTSRLGIHYRFGTISIREKARKALALNGVYLNELIWRDFYMTILAKFPHVVSGPFRKEYSRIGWINNEAEFHKWCDGKTGYPIVDAGMRELNATGYMHNRVRMITASFLTKHLLIDWRWGEAYFARKLLDFDLAANNGGWQWAAGCGTDAAPYFRVFNPLLQLQRFDKQLEYVKRWVPEYGTKDYAAPIVNHEMARRRCIEVYKKALSQ
jgi:deoxyribodipyrimidine photo-lyase